MTDDQIMQAVPTAEIGQATAVEQARAVAEVQAAVVVAQQVPRDPRRAEADMHDACGRYGMADRAFYAVPKRGSGPSVHLARELARIWGNVQYGVHELRRDDDAGISEIQAFAWDVQTNTRSTRTFIVPHARMAKGKRQALVDLSDVYLNNQNIGARAVRECIFTILPAWFTDAAVDDCKATLERGQDGVTLAERVGRMVAAFRDLGVTVAQLETRTGRTRGLWDGATIADLQVIWRSLKAGETTTDVEFVTVTASELVGGDGQSTRAPARLPDRPSGDGGKPTDDRGIDPAEPSPDVTPVDGPMFGSADQ